MKRLLIWLGVGVAALIALPFVVIACMLIFGTAKVPEPLTSVTAPFSEMDFSRIPAIERYRARDGAMLSYRYYPAAGKQVAVLIHGSAGSSGNMHAMAQALQATGVAVYAPDLRGHGANQPHGDVAYTGQLDDDMADFLEAVKPKQPQAEWTLVGFSSGGGFALRVAGGALKNSFDRYVLLSPFLSYDAPTVRHSEGNAVGKSRQAWSTTSLGRIIGLVALDAAGYHGLDGLPVIYFAVPKDVPSVTSSYSWRMQLSFQPHDDFRADIRAVSKPMQVFVGANDELFVPEKFQEVFGGVRKDIPVTILPGLGHSDLATSPVAIRAVVGTFKAVGE
jgi:pimeloyl-ACP methyl ester carboxylesterase